MHTTARLYKESKIKFGGSIYQFSDVKPSTIIPGKEISIRGDNNEIRSLLISICWPRRRHEYINIEVHSSRNTRTTSKNYVSTRHQPGTWVWINLVILDHRSKYMVGTDRMLSIDSKIPLNRPHENVSCDIRTSRVIFVHGMFVNKTSYIRRLRFTFQCFLV